MIHTLMEVDLHTTVPPLKVRGPTSFRHHKQNRMLKRERSPEESDADADRPLKRAAGRHRLSTIPSGNSSRQNSEDWVQQTGGLSIDSPLVPPSEGTYYFANNGNVAGAIGVAGPGPTTSSNMDEDIDMAEEAESTLQVDSTSQNHSNSTVVHRSSTPFLQQIAQRRLNMSRHPYGAWAQPSRIADSSGPMINIVPATPAHSQQSLTLLETHVNPLSHSGQTQFMLQAQRERVATPPLPDSTAMSDPAGAPFHQEPAPNHLAATRRRITFGPRLDCEKCKQGEVHFTHFDYQ